MERLRDLGEVLQDRLWSPRQESNLYLALRRHLFYPLNYGEIDLVTGKAETFSINLLTLPMGISGFFCFVLNEAP